MARIVCAGPAQFAFENREDMVCVERHYRDDNVLRLHGFQVALRQQAHAHALLGFGENDCIFTQTHRTWLETIPIQSNWDMTIHGDFVTEAKAKKKSKI